MARPRGSVHPPATRRAAGGRGDGRGQADRVPCFFFWGGEWTAGARAEERPACPQGALGLLVGLEGVAMDSVAPAPKTHGRPGVSGLGFLRKASCGRAPHRNRPPASTGGAAASPPAAVRAVSAPAAPAPRRGPEREAGPPHLERRRPGGRLRRAHGRACSTARKITSQQACVFRTSASGHSASRGRRSVSKGGEAGTRPGEEAAKTDRRRRERAAGGGRAEGSGRQGTETTRPRREPLLGPSRPTPLLHARHSSSIVEWALALDLATSGGQVRLPSTP
ncbi:unnamed protein product [Prorocentrum cordatum]|uniref:Uncharacterized protein n=1 Tax=Prorocentrum cordatum TaxID=2364126 RepID=A0ABN9V3X2_9DINO|nr:unnamed protein product [Polarella glacialis]